MSLQNLLLVICLCKVYFCCFTDHCADFKNANEMVINGSECFFFFLPKVVSENTLFTHLVFNKQLKLGE